MNTISMRSIGTLLIACWLAILWPAHADDLGVIALKQLPEIVTDGGGQVSYTAGTRRFTVSASGFVTRFTEGVNTFWDFSAPRSIAIDFVVDTSACVPSSTAPAACGVSPGAGISPSGANLRVIGTIPTEGYSGVLLEGEIVAMGFLDGTVDAFDFRFHPTGGAMLDLFAGKEIGMRFTTEGSSFQGSFATKFSGGRIKGSIFVIPSELNTESSIGSLGDRVFEDLNGNGVQDCADTNNDGIVGDAGDDGAECAAGIGGVAVELLDAADGICGNGNDTSLGTTMTDSAGFYGFEQLAAGSYCVQVTRPKGICDFGTAAFTGQNQGGDDAVDSDVDADGVSELISLTDGQMDLGRDAGVVCPARVGDRLWDDTDHIDGLQSSDTGAEPGIAGADVILYACVDGAPDTTTGTTTQTDAQGFYEFFAAPGSYAVGFGIPADLAARGYIFTLANQGTDDGFDSDADRNTGITGCFTVASKESDLSLDGGVFEPNASLGDTCFHDLNANGIQDQDEPGIAGCKIELFENPGGGACQATAGNFVSELETAGGLYLFKNMQGGDYCLKVTPPADFCDIGEVHFSPRAQGGDATRDSDVDAAGLTGNISLGYNQANLTRDAGLYCGARVGDRVFEDSNRDNRQNCADTDMDGIIGETNGDDTGAECASGIDDVLVKLLTPGADGVCNTADDGNTGMSQLTAAGGFYLFDTDPGSYCIEIEPPTGYACVAANVGENSGESDVEAAVSGGVACRTSETIVLPSNTEDRTWDAGVAIPAAPAIHIEKATNGVDADLPGTGLALTIGDAVTWTYAVINTGNVDLVNAVVTDNIEGYVCTIDNFAVNETSSCELHGSATQALYLNNGTVVARPAYDPVNGPAVTDTDPSQYTASEPSVDGDIADWDLGADFFHALYEAGKPNKAHLADAYVRYADGKLYVLVLATDGNSVDQRADEAWVKIYDLGGSTQVDGNSARFEWVSIGGEVRGYEAAFDLAAGGYARAEIHLSVNGGATASTGKKKQDYVALEAVERCPGGSAG